MLKFPKSPSISGVIIAQDEEQFISAAINNIYNVVNEIVILDGGSEDQTVKVVKDFPDPQQKIRLFRNTFGGHIGDQKNTALSKVRGVWSLLIDCDETLEPKLLEMIPRFVTTNKYECYAISRINLINGVKTDVYPDYQLRLFRSFCRWVKAPHEENCGWKDYKMLCLEGEGYHIIHNKTSDRQGVQDARYDVIKKAKLNMGDGEIVLESDFWDNHNYRDFGRLNIEG